MITRGSLGDAYPIDKLGNVVEFLDNMRRPITESERISGPYPYYGANGIQGTINDFIFDEPLVLLAEDGGHFDSPDRGIAYRVSGRTWVNNHAHVLRPRKNIDINYLCRVLENYDVKPFVTGTTRGKLTKGGASEIPIPLPPLPEQRRIAAILDKADALRAKRRAALAEIDQLTQSIFIEMFGDPSRNVKDWPLRTLKELGKVSTGGTPASSMVGMFGGEIPFVTPGDLESDQPVRRTLTEAGAQEAGTVRAGAALVCCIGATIGKMSLARVRSSFNQQLNAVEWFSEAIDDIYGLAALRFFKPTIVAWGASTTLPILKKSSFEKIAIPVPALQIQQDFSRRVRVVETLKDGIRTALNLDTELFHSIQYRAFQGEF